MKLSWLRWSVVIFAITLLGGHDSRSGADPVVEHSTLFADHLYSALDGLNKQIDHDEIRNHLEAAARLCVHSESRDKIEDAIRTLTTPFANRPDSWPSHADILAINNEIGLAFAYERSDINRHYRQNSDLIEMLLRLQMFGEFGKDIHIDYPESSTPKELVMAMTSDYFVDPRSAEWDPEIKRLVYGDAVHPLIHISAEAVFHRPDGDAGVLFEKQMLAFADTYKKLHLPVKIKISRVGFDWTVYAGTYALRYAPALNEWVKVVLGAARANHNLTDMANHVELLAGYLDGTFVASVPLAGQALDLGATTLRNFDFQVRKVLKRSFGFTRDPEVEDIVASVTTQAAHRTANKLAEVVTKLEAIDPKYAESVGEGMKDTAAVQAAIDAINENPATAPSRWREIIGVLTEAKKSLDAITANLTRFQEGVKAARLADAAKPMLSAALEAARYSKLYQSVKLLAASNGFHYVAIAAKWVFIGGVVLVTAVAAIDGFDRYIHAETADAKDKAIAEMVGAIATGALYLIPGVGIWVISADIAMRVISWMSFGHLHMSVDGTMYYVALGAVKATRWVGKQIDTYIDHMGPTNPADIELISKWEKELRLPRLTDVHGNIVDDDVYASSNPSDKTPIGWGLNDVINKTRDFQAGKIGTNELNESLKQYDAHLRQTAALFIIQDRMVSDQAEDRYSATIRDYLMWLAKSWNVFDTTSYLNAAYNACFKAQQLLDDAAAEKAKSDAAAACKGAKAG